MQTDFSSNRIIFVSALISVTFITLRIINVLTKMVLKNSLGDQGTWLPVRPTVTYADTLDRLSVAEHLARPIA